MEICGILIKNLLSVKRKSPLVVYVKEHLHRPLFQIIHIPAGAFSCHPSAGFFLFASQTLYIRTVQTTITQPTTESAVIRSP